MSLSILSGAMVEYGRGHAVFYDTGTEWAFGPVFCADTVQEAVEQAESFQAWVATQTGSDLRTIPANELESLHGQWLAERETSA